MLIFLNGNRGRFVNEKLDLEKLEKKIKELEHDINQLRNKEKYFSQIEHKANYIFQKEKLQTISDLLKALCHEMNQPLQAISGYSELIILDFMENDSAQQNMEQIREQINKAVSINDKIANVAKHLKE